MNYSVIAWGWGVGTTDDSLFSMFDCFLMFSVSRYC